VARAAAPKQRRAATLAQVEADHLARVMAACEGNKSAAAAILGIDRRSLQRKLLVRKRARRRARR
jgi:ActR/RegA family two-component response regulator